MNIWRFHTWDGNRNKIWESKKHNCDLKPVYVREKEGRCFSCHVNLSRHGSLWQESFTVFQNRQERDKRNSTQVPKLLKVHGVCVLIQHTHTRSIFAHADARRYSGHFDTCPRVPTSHPVYTAWGNRWFVSSAIYIQCILKHLSPSQKHYHERWIEEHKRVSSISMTTASFLSQMWLLILCAAIVDLFWQMHTKQRTKSKWLNLYTITLL